MRLPRETHWHRCEVEREGGGGGGGEGRRKRERVYRSRRECHPSG